MAAGKYRPTAKPRIVTKYLLDMLAKEKWFGLKHASRQKMFILV